MATTGKGAPHLDAALLRELRVRLEEERARLQGMLRIATINEGVEQVHDPLDTSPEDFGELGQDITALDTEQALSENDRRLLKQVEHALQRMDQGQYGLSEVTGKLIPIERLEALPWATTNVDDPHTP